MVKASDFESEDCRFESCVGLHFLPIIVSIYHYSIRIYIDAIQTFEWSVALLHYEHAVDGRDVLKFISRVRRSILKRKSIEKYALTYHSNVE